MKLVEYAKKIINNAFKIEALTLDPLNPYKWASGFRMPIYIDNRKHLQQSEYRGVIADSMCEIIKEENLEFELLSGTPTAGIAPAATLAQKLEKKLVVEHKGEYYNYDKLTKELISNTETKNYDIIVSTSPHAIASGVQLANNSKLGFAYIRSKKKDHGLQQQIEGVVKSIQNVLLVDYHMGDSYLESAKQKIEELGCEVSVISQDVTSKVEKIEINGKKMLEVEDHISLGGSSIERVETHRMKGAEVVGVLSNSNYGFPQMFEEFKQAKCNVYSSVWYSDIVEVAKEENKFTNSQLEVLSELSELAFDWGEKNGFPRYSERLKE